MSDMKRIMIIISMISALAFLTTVSAYQVDENTVIQTLGGDFNYSFANTMNFSNIAWFSDRITLNYTNISISPASGTGNATIYQFRQDYINFTVCGQGQNFNLSFQNLSSSMVLNISADSIEYPNHGNDTNITFSATGACKAIYLISDTTAPVFASVIPGDGAQITSATLTVQAELTEPRSNVCILSMDSVNYTMTRSGATCTKTFYNLPTKVYSFYVWANDTLGNSAASSSRSITVLQSNAATPSAAPSASNSAPTTTTQHATIVSFETVNPVIAGGKTTLKCIYQGDRGEIENPAMTFNVNGEDRTDIKYANGVHSISMTFKKHGTISWTCTASKPGYQTVSKTRIIDVLDVPEAIEYLETIAEEVRDNSSIGEDVNLESSVLDESKAPFISPTGQILLNQNNQSQNLVAFVLVVVIIGYLVIQKEKGG